MIVTCERCASQFQLDETKISPNGARVRCSRCEHAFFVESPEQPDADHAEDLVRDVLGADPSEASGGSLETDTVLVETRDPIDLDKGEDDWEFNDETGAIESGEGDAEVSEEELDAARKAVDGLLGGVFESAPSVLPEVDADSDSGLELDYDLEDEISSELDTELDGEFEDDDPAVIEQVAPAQTSAEDHRPNSDRVAEPGEVAEPQTELPEAVDDEFEDPADWDLFDAETSGDIPIASAASELGTELPDSFSAAPKIGVTGAARSSRFAARLLESVGWAFVVALVTVCLSGVLSTPKLEVKPWPLGSVKAAGFELQGVSARWVDNAVAGRMYVITGELRRSEGTTPWNVVPLAVQMLDPEGRSLDVPLTAIGPEIPERTLRATSPTDLVDQQNEGAAHLAASAAGWMGFAAVIPVVPARAERIEFSPMAPTSGS